MMNTSKLYVYNLICKVLPPTRCFRLKASLLRWCGAKVGKNVRICSSVMVIGSGNLEIGDNTWIGPNTLISTSSEIKIGSDCDIAPMVYIGDGTHNITPNYNRIAGKDISLPISIGDGCWICAKSTILANTSIGKMCVVAAGAVVTSKFTDEYSLIAGVPARIIKNFRV